MKKLRYKHIAFDFDGTLADSYYLAKEYFDLAAKDSGIESLSKEQILKMREQKLTFKMALRILKQKRIGIFKIAKLVKNLTLELLQSKRKLHLFQGMPLLLNELKDAGAKLYIISYNRFNVIEEELKVNKCLSLFDEIYALDLFHNKEEKLKELMSKLKIKQREIIYIGDEVRDVDFAHKIDIGVIAVSWGFNTKKALREHKPEYEAENISELKDILVIDE